MLNITKNVEGPVLTFTLEGILDTQSAPSLQKEITERDEGISSIIFDCEKLEYLTSAGLRVLLVAQQDMDDIEGTMIMRNVSSDIMDVFKLTGFLDVLTIE